VGHQLHYELPYYQPYYVLDTMHLLCTSSKGVTVSGKARHDVLVCCCTLAAALGCDRAGVNFVWTRLVMILMQRLTCSRQDA
jgi:hypothetical protein